MMGLGMHMRLRARSLTSSCVGAGIVLVTALAPMAQSHVMAAGAGAPKTGGTLTVWNGNAPDCLDPQKTALEAGATFDEKVVDPLLIVDPKGKLKPDLATSFKVSKSGKQLNFTLRQGVKFSNGDPFNAQSVKYTFDRAIDPANKTTISSTLVDSIAKIKTTGTYGIQLNLKTSSRTLLFNIASTALGILDPKAKTTCDTVTGTGPWMIKSISPGYSTMTLVRNPNHNWEPAWYTNRGAAYISTLVLKSIADNATAISELLAGQIDVGNVPGDQLSRVQGNKSFTLKKYATQGLDWMGFNVTKAPFNNADVRKAFAEAIDRQSIVRAAFNGQAKVAYSAIPATVPYYDKKSKSYSTAYNPTDAQKIFAANHVTGPFDMIIYDLPTFNAMAQLVQAELAQVGVTVNIVAKAPADYIQQAIKGDFDIYILDYFSSDPDILYLLMDSSQANGNGYNFGQINIPALDTALENGRETLSQKKATADYKQVQQIVNQQNLIVPFCSTLTNVALDKRVHGFHLGIGGTIPWADLSVSG